MRDEKSLQQLQEEVALNGLPPTVRATRHTRPAEVFVRFFLKSVQIAPPPRPPRTPHTPTRPAAANRMSNNNRHQEIKINLCIFYKKNKKKIKKTHCVSTLPWITLKHPECSVKNKNLLYYVHKNNALSFPPLLIFFFQRVFKLLFLLRSFFFSVIKIDQSFSWRRFPPLVDQLLRMWAEKSDDVKCCPFSLNPPKKDQNKKHRNRQTTDKHTHARTQTNTLTGIHVFLLSSMFKSGCLVMVWSTDLFQLNPVRLDSFRSLGPTLPGAAKHTTQRWHSKPTGALALIIV